MNDVACHQTGVCVCRGLRRQTGRRPCCDVVVDGLGPRRQRPTATCDETTGGGGGASRKTTCGVSSWTSGASWICDGRLQSRSSRTMSRLCVCATICACGKIYVQVRVTCIEEIVKTEIFRMHASWAHLAGERGDAAQIVAVDSSRCLRRLQRQMVSAG